jgi:hypothetical protein
VGKGALAPCPPSLHSNTFGGHAALCPPYEAALHPGYESRRPHTFSNGTSIWLRFSSHAGTGRFFERMNSGLNSFD